MAPRLGGRRRGCCACLAAGPGAGDTAAADRDGLRVRCAEDGKDMAVQGLTSRTCTCQQRRCGLAPVTTTTTTTGGGRAITAAPSSRRLRCRQPPRRPERVVQQPCWDRVSAALGALGRDRVTRLDASLLDAERPRFACVSAAGSPLHSACTRTCVYIDWPASSPRPLSRALHVRHGQVSTTPR
ncbi:hypothetical protein HPB50_010280 [Hyalomma asiaticum]|uniref:Uncharacterized protein n=1 Tax=Hyalomma asiaticum TaxID=266040 RepID=A0ACB7SX83_HYAAI|nr:hypothetical protein HPB50_010280 [Hyalomma asiaticum]